MTEIQIEDNKNILNDKNLDWYLFENKTVLITGATGLIGQHLVNVLKYINNALNINVKILANGRNQEKAKLLFDNTVQFIQGDIRSELPLNDIKEIDFIIHCAGVVNSYDMVNSPVDTIATSVNGTQNILELAVKKHCKSFVFISSMEVYGENTKTEVKENDLGYIDLCNVRNSYPESKRLCELLAVSYGEQYNLHTTIARLPLTYGAGAIQNIDDNRVLNQFFRKAINGEDIELHTTGKSTTNCCYTSDVIRGIFTILIKGESMQIYNIGNSNCSCTIKKLAQHVAKIVGNDTKVIINIPENIKNLGYAADKIFAMNDDKIRKLGYVSNYDIDGLLKRSYDDYKCTIL